jgi:hypothetical protein
VDLVQAWTHLGIEPTDDPDAIRAAYLRRLRVVHPDTVPAAETAAANDATIALVDAYRVAVQHVDGPTAPVDAPPSDVARPAARPTRPFVPIGLLEDDTIGVALPPDATYALVVEAAHHLGEVTHIEPSSGLLQVIVEFVEAPPCSLLLSLQGRATGVTEVFCTVESLEAEPAPPIDAVARLLLEQMVAVSAP